MGMRAKSAAGHVIEAFGTFLIGGDYVVGLFVFAILVIINMIVVTKGAGRVSEVSRRASRSMRCRASRWRSTPISTPA